MSNVRRFLYEMEVCLCLSNNNNKKNYYCIYVFGDVQKNIIYIQAECKRKS